MSKRSDLLESITNTIEDYRAGEIASPTPAHVEEWIQQFDEGVQEPMLAELDHVFKRTYISKAIATKFLTSLIKIKKLAGDSPCEFWEDVHFLDIQENGNSQHEILEMFEQVLKKECDLVIKDCGSKPEVFLYLDDGIFSGNRVRNDLTEWIESDAPSKAKVHVVVMAGHLGGQHYASAAILKAASKANKEIDITWWCYIKIEDRKTNIDTSGVLRPSSLPNNELAKSYVKFLKESGYPPVLRQAGKMGDSNVFSSEAGRDILEQQLLQAGFQIRDICPNLKENHRPLGYMVLRTLGFGSLTVTFRNCPNNCPLAFWAGDPWYPLFQRKTN